MNTYQLTHRSKCPNGELMDAYTVTVRSPQTIMVEELLATLKAAPETIYHEDLATYLRNRIGAEVIVEGWHHGVHITSTRR